MNTFDKLSRIELEDASAFLNSHFPFINSVEVTIQLGSGQTADGLFDEEWGSSSLQDLPRMPAVESVAHHDLSIRWGMIGNVRTLVLSGRYHMYEGYGLIPCILPIWAAANCGCRVFVFSNASGGIREDLVPGRIMLIRDHVNNLGVSPLAGHHHLMETPYVDMTTLYNAELADSLLATARRLELEVAEGVYMANLGPHFETPAEIRMARAIGADTVGMSTVLEATTAHAAGGRVLGLSLVSNRAAGLGNGPISHEDNVAGVGNAAGQLRDLLRAWLIKEAVNVL
jgi:purine-nucleoside phosphorylase